MQRKAGSSRVGVVGGAARSASSFVMSSAYRPIAPPVPRPATSPVSRRVISPDPRPISHSTRRPITSSVPRPVIPSTSRPVFWSATRTITASAKYPAVSRAVPRGVLSVPGTVTRSASFAGFRLLFVHFRLQDESLPARAATDCCPGEAESQRMAKAGRSQTRRIRPACCPPCP